MERKDYSYRGKHTGMFEKILSDYVMSYVVCTNTGTSALYLALKLAGVGKGDYVICPAISYVATVNAILYTGAIPFFCDVKNDLTIDINRLKENHGFHRLIKAIIPVHILGKPCDMEAVINFANALDIKIIEDSCQALGSFYFSGHCGTFGNFGVLSFNGNKIITTGGGGALICKEKKDYEKAKHLSMVAKINKDGQCYHDQLGYNFRMSSYNAELGIKQFRKKKIYFDYLKREARKKYIVCNGWGKISNEKDSQKIWTPLHFLPHLKDYPRTDCSNAERIGREIKIKINY